GGGGVRPARVRAGRPHDPPPPDWADRDVEQAVLGTSSAPRRRPGGGAAAPRSVGGPHAPPGRQPTVRGRERTGLPSSAQGWGGGVRLAGAVTPGRTPLRAHGPLMPPEWAEQ